MTQQITFKASSVIENNFSAQALSRSETVERIFRVINQTFEALKPFSENPCGFFPKAHLIFSESLTAIRHFLPADFYFASLKVHAFYINKRLKVASLKTHQIICQFLASIPGALSLINKVFSVVFPILMFQVNPLVTTAASFIDLAAQGIKTLRASQKLHAAVVSNTHIAYRVTKCSMKVLGLICAALTLNPTLPCLAMYAWAVPALDLSATVLEIGFKGFNKA